jgi:hypothetical protein
MALGQSMRVEVCVQRPYTLTLRLLSPKLLE